MKFFFGLWPFRLLTALILLTTFVVLTDRLLAQDGDSQRQGEARYVFADGMLLDTPDMGGINAPPAEAPAPPVVVAVDQAPSIWTVKYWADAVVTAVAPLLAVAVTWIVAQLAGLLPSWLGGPLTTLIQKVLGVADAKNDKEVGESAKKWVQFVMNFLLAAMGIKWEDLQDIDLREKFFDRVSAWLRPQFPELYAWIVSSSPKANFIDERKTAHQFYEAFLPPESHPQTTGSTAGGRMPPAASGLAGTGGGFAGAGNANLGGVAAAQRQA